MQGGFARHSGFWYHWISSLARRYRIVRRDTRGHGRSSTPKPSDNYAYTLETILTEIVDTLDQLGLDKVHFLLESTSGMLGEAFAVGFPNRLLSLAVCSSPTYLSQVVLDLFSFGLFSWPKACRKLGSKAWGSFLPASLAHSQQQIPSTRHGGFHRSERVPARDLPDTPSFCHR